MLTALALILPSLFTAGQDRPLNLVLMIADDQGHADLGCAGLAKDVNTPQLDRLAKRGARFTQAYATAPICNAARAAILTGCYQQRFGTIWYGGKGLPRDRFTTLPEVLSARGYRCGYIGKFHYGSAATHQPGQRSFPLEHGFESLFGFSGGRKHYLIHEQQAEDEFQATRKLHQRRGQSLQKGPFFDADTQVDQRGLSTELLGTRARKFIEQHRDDPFFLMLSFNAVHNFTHQLPASYLKEHGLTGYHDWDPATEEYHDWYREGRAPHHPEGRELYLGQLHFLDVEVGRVLDHLDDLGLTDNTVVVYIGDNGGSTPIYANNGPLRGSKYTLYEGGIRVPLLIAGPALVADRVFDEVVSAMDLYPTLCRLAGAPLPEHLDGKDLGALLRGEAAGSQHSILHWETGHESAVRHGKWKLHMAHSRQHADHEMVELKLGEFLRDLEADPGEQVNLIDQHPEVAERLRVAHREWQAQLSR